MLLVYFMTDILQKAVALQSQDETGQTQVSTIVKDSFVFPWQSSCQEWRRKWPAGSIRLSVFLVESSGDVLLTAMGEMILWEDLLYLMSRSKKILAPIHYSTIWSAGV